MLSGWPGLNGRPTPATMPRNSKAPKLSAVTFSPVRPSFLLGRSGRSMTRPTLLAKHYLETAASPVYETMNVPLDTFIGRAQGMVVVEAAKTDVRWWHGYVLPHSSDIRFIKGRLKFSEYDGGAFLVLHRRVQAAPASGSRLGDCSRRASCDGRKCQADRRRLRGPSRSADPFWYAGW